MQEEKNTKSSITDSPKDTSDFKGSYFGGNVLMGYSYVLIFIVTVFILGIALYFIYPQIDCI